MDLHYIQSYSHGKTDFTSVENEMLSYVRDSIVQRTFIALVRIAISINFITIAIWGVTSGISRLICLLIGGYFGLGVIYYYTSSENYRTMIKFLKMNNLYDEAINDFPQAKSFLYDRIRLGSKYVFGWHYCTVLRYNDIIKVYQYVRKANFQEMERVLHAVDKLGNVWSLCKLDTHAPTIFFHHANELVDKRLMEVISLMLHKNPKIIVGYW